MIRYPWFHGQGGGLLRRGAVVLVTLATVAGAQVAGSADVPSAGLLLVVNKGDRTLGIVDPVAGSRSRRPSRAASPGTR